jgi:hypothetical protein
MAGTTRLEPAASAVTEIFRPEHLANFGLACSFLIPSFVGAGCAFLAGLRWYLFGICCLFAATVVECLYLLGY